MAYNPMHQDRESLLRENEALRRRIAQYDKAQAEKYQWIVRIIGLRSIGYRILAFLEEAFEAALIGGVTIQDIEDLLHLVESRPVQSDESLGCELGDCLSTLYVLAEDAGVNVHEEMNKKHQDNLAREQVIRGKIAQKDQLTPYNRYPWRGPAQIPLYLNEAARREGG
jgi:hypothetical protein